VHQSGAAIGALAFPVIGPVGVVAIRQWVAGTVLLVVGRPRLRTFTRGQWLPVIGLAAVFAAMNLAVYMAIDRIGLGLAVTLEFLGPLTVALAGALTATPTGVRRRVTLACAILAAIGVLVLTRPSRPPTTWASALAYSPRVLGQLHPAQPHGRATLHRRRGIGGGRRGVRSGGRADRGRRADRAPAHGCRAGLAVIPFVADVLALRAACPRREAARRQEHPCQASRR
jgi:inner membrane transporter RhtA